MTESVDVRALRSEDRGAWARLWDGYLQFYRQPLPAATTDQTFENLCAGRHGLFALVAVDDTDTPIGLVHAVMHATTWSENPVCYLEDLYVDPNARGGDIGRRLIEATGSTAEQRGAGKLYWHTQQFNGRARSLYDRVGELQSSVRYNRPLTPGA